MTERLYYHDAYLRSFSASIAQAREWEGRQALILDATAFYPTGGGQPHDRGTLNGVTVVDVCLDADDAVLHVVDGEVQGPTVCGELDWDRRFDHMQQHTGQHILSQAFVEVCGAETVSFHLGEEACTIDLDLAPLADTEAARAERLAAAVVLDDRPVVSRFVTREELSAMPLRKRPAVDGPVRIVQVEAFDWSPCGGTHVSRTGEVGPIKVLRVERRKDLSRVLFCCGWRALRDYARKHAIVQALAAHLTTSDGEILPSVERVEAELKQSRRALQAAQTELLEHRVAHWMAGARVCGAFRVVQVTLEDVDVALLREAARRLVEPGGHLALLALSGPRPQFVFAASEDVAVDVGALLRAATATVGGRGGGRGQFAQGGAPEGAPVDAVLDAACTALGTMGERGTGS